ncbi:Gfo/Idh/MocA family protein [Cohnella soli]|uniref:Gfo/Idh/MocA family protein n=1 Tax=Cohnella soli TaxID=425005 RepID=A0ABW0I5C1_9BACL
MQQKVRVGVLGAGKIAQFRHLPELSFRDDVEILCICDKNVDRASEIAKQYGIPQVYEHFDQLIAEERLDAVTICLPNALHADATLLALAKDLHVLVEKPMATTMEDCRRIVEAYNHSNRIVMVGCNQRFHPLNRRAKELLQSGAIGTVYQFSANFHHGGPEQWSVDERDSWFFDAAQSGSGVTFDLGFHKIDLIRWMLEDTITNISSFRSRTRAWTEVEDNAVMMIQTESGAIGTVSISWCNPQQDHRTCLYGSRGTIVFGESLFGLTVHHNDGDSMTEEIVPEFRTDGKLNSGVIDHFVDSIVSGRRTDAECTSVLPSMEALFAL